MAVKKNGKNIYKRFNLKKQRKLNVAFFLVLLIIVFLNIQIIRIQVDDGEQYKKQVLSQQNFDSKTLPYRRGDIRDRNGTILATSQKVYNLILDCKLVNTEEAYISATVEAISKCFPDLDEGTIRQVLKEKAESRYAVLKKKISYDDKQKFAALQEDKKKGPFLKGIWFEEEYQRYYPNGSLACDLVGYTNSGNVGNWGIEEYYNTVLNGTNGREYGYLNSDSEHERVIKEAADGNNVVSTIDTNIQKIVERKILEFNETHKDEARSGNGSKNTAVIIQNPNNGEILAEASYPVFDLNNPRDLVLPGIVSTQEAADAMSEEDKLKALNQVWRNFCLSDTFEPGSTAKPFTVAMGLETGKLSGEETFLCDGSETVGGHKIHCVKRSGHGQETIAQAIMNSCNDALMQMSYAIGMDTFTKYQSIFGFGKKTNIDLPAEENAANLIYTKDTMTAVDLAISSFGQGFNTTMTQMMAGFSSLINGGKYYEPHVVKKITDANGATVKTVESKLVRQTVSKETSQMIKGYLYETVMNGTAKTALVDGYTMGGKTGTAEKSPRKQGNYVISFIGYVPANNPQVAIYVVIDEPNIKDQAHSVYATTMAKEILTEVLPYMNIFPGVDEPLEGEQPETIPAQTGESVDTENGQEIQTESIFE